MFVAHNQCRSSQNLEPVPVSMIDILKIEIVIFVSLPRFSHLKTRYFTLAELETARWGLGLLRRQNENVGGDIVP